MVGSLTVFSLDAVTLSAPDCSSPSLGSRYTVFVIFLFTAAECEDFTGIWLTSVSRDHRRSLRAWTLPPLPLEDATLKCLYST